MPLALVGLAATAVGTGLTIAGNAQAQSAENAARTNEVNQQAALQKQQDQLFQNSLTQSTPQTANAALQTGTATRTNAWQNLNNASTPIASALPLTSSSSPTGKATARASSAAQTWNALNAGAQAKEGSYGDWENQQAIKDANTAQQQSILNNFSQGDAELLPTEMNVASQAGDSLSGWGSIVSSLGKVAGGLGASGLLGSTTTPLAEVGNYPPANNMINSAASAQSAAKAYNSILPWSKIY